MIEVAYQAPANERDFEDEPLCYGDHTTERQDFYGRWITYNLPCICPIVPVGIVNGRARFAVKSSGSEFDDLPF